MANMSNQQRLGRYWGGGYTDVKGNRLGWWERTVFATDPSDITFELIQKYNRRPDLVSYDVYGRSDLQWLVMQYNNISDVTVEFVTGTTIILPTRSRLLGGMLVKSAKVSPL
jgi:hypothetical protein